MTTPARGTREPRILLLWPGTVGAAAGNFGVPQLVTIASYLKARTGAHIDIVDLVCERALGPFDLPGLFAGRDGKGYDIVGLSCYSSYDYLLIEAIAKVARAALPNAVIVTGGYHASARPADFLEEGSPFDAVIIGEAEKPLVRIIESVLAGTPPRGEIFRSDPITDLEELPPSDWSFLEKYRPVLRKVASQLQVYLSRGCPFDCAFCMERAKREVSWRAYSVERAIDEMRRLHAFADLTGMTVYIADALFGMRPSWRRAFLSALAKEKLPAQKIWLLVRVDLIDDEDLRLFAEANCSPGFGLESGDPGLLGVIRKAGRLDDYLDRMRRVAARARELDVPWGANIIVGHPGETEQTLRTTADYMRELFLDPKGTTGFLSIDPFRLYPGSPIDDERSAWEKRFGTRFHRPEWYKDGDQEFLSEWVDPSESLDYRTRAALSHELFAPIVSRIQDNFVYKGAARGYFLRAVYDQAAQTGARSRLHDIGRFYAWHRYLGRGSEGSRALLRDRETRDLLRGRRDTALRRMAKERFPGAPDDAAAFLRSPIANALREVPRERFVPLDLILESARDEPVPLDAAGHSTVSALHAYEHTFRLARIQEGYRVLDVGGGTGYGAAILSRLVGATGRVVTIELDRRLCDVALSLVGEPIHVVCGDALEESTLKRAQERLSAGLFDAITCGFAVSSIPPLWTSVLRDGGVIVAPVGEGESQCLVRAQWRDGALTEERFGPVHYVRVRRRADLPEGPKERARPSGHLPLLGD